MYQPNEFESHQQMIEMSSNKKSSENELGRNDRDDETGHEIVEAPPSGDDDDEDSDQKNKRQRFHRHTSHQIQEMEAYFKDCPHPDDKQRRRLGRELGLEPLQVKFWFQNKRTQLKSHQERRENALLKAENEKLRGENIRYKEALSSATCPTCGGTPALGEMCFDEQQLKVENTRLREEIERVSRVAAKFGVRAGGSYYNMSPQNNMASRSLDYGGSIYGGNNELLSSLQAPLDSEKPIIVELAVAAVDELIRLAIDVDNLWVPVDHGTEVLNHDEYIRTCATALMGPKPLGLKTEASRETAVVIMNHSNLVEIFMDVNKWSTMFYGIVARATTHEVLSTGVGGNYNGAMQVMSAEFVVPSSLVPTRDNYFVRYCKQHCEDSWIVVDVSLDHLRPTATSRSRRRPSGCIIQELPNGYSKVMWVEHAEVDEGGVHDFYKPLVNSCLAFGAKRWVASLDRQCERLASAMATNIPTGDLCVITTHVGRKSMLKVAERMIMSFCSGVGASTAHWTQLAPTGNDEVKVMTRKCVDDPGRPSGVVLNATTSLWLPVPPKRLFDFLRDENSRNQWDILSNGGLVQEMAHIANGRDPGNCVSLLRVNCTSISQTNMLILQESLTDATGSYVVYAPIDLASMNAVLIGGDPDTVALLPSGFAVLPDGPTLYNGGPIMEVGTGGSLLTVAFQILVDSVPTAKIAVGSVTTVSNLIQCTIERIRAAVMCNTGF